MRTITELRVRRTNGSCVSGKVSEILRFELPIFEPALAETYPELTGRVVKVWFTLAKTGKREWCCNYLEQTTGHWEVGDN